VFHSAAEQRGSPPIPKRGEVVVMVMIVVIVVIVVMMVMVVIVMVIVMVVMVVRLKAFTSKAARQSTDI
jgi:uncharacterized membrane protein YdbT with pleckstrin-like domain